MGLVLALTRRQRHDHGSGLRHGDREKPKEWFSRKQIHDVVGIFFLRQITKHKSLLFLTSRNETGCVAQTFKGDILRHLNGQGTQSLSRWWGWTLETLFAMNLINPRTEPHTHGLIKQFLSNLGRSDREFQETAITTGRLSRSWGCPWNIQKINQL